MGRHNQGFQLAELDAAIWLGNTVGVVLVGMGMRPSLLNRLGGDSLDGLERGISSTLRPTQGLGYVGGYWNSRHVTPDGLEHTFVLNHLTPFLLTHLLVARLKADAPARVVTVASDAEALGRIDFDDLQGERSYSGAQAYNQSKLANLLFTYALARRLRHASVTANALHPGLVSTAFGADDRAGIQRVLVPLLRPFMRSPIKGAATSTRLASASDLEGVTGRYFVNGRPRRSSKRSYDEFAATRLWQVSAQLVGLTSS